MKKIFIMLCALSLVLSCTDGKQGLDNELPPHISGGQQTPGEDEGDSGDYPLEPGNPGGNNGSNEGTVAPEGEWADKQPTGEPMTISLMSYNVGKFNKFSSQLGHDSYPEVAECINYGYADVVGLNEVNKGQQTSLATTLGKDWSGSFYYANSSTYGNAIVYNKCSNVVNRDLRVTIPKTGGAGEVRSMGAVEFEDFVFCVTHLDHKSDQARQDGARLITEWALQNYGYGKTTKPVFLTGDMNCNQNNVTIKYFEKYWTRISVVGGTFPSSGQCIDFIFVLNNGIKYEVGTTKVVNNKALSVASVASDHYAVYSQVTFHKQK